MTLETLSESYTDKTIYRAIVQAIPTIGGPLDLLFSSKGEQIKQNRTQIFLEDLRERLSKIENQITINSSDDEVLFDVFTNILENVQKTRSKEKIKRFSNVVAKKFQENHSWDETEEVIEVLSRLKEIDIQLLIRAVEVPKCESPFEGL